MPHKARDVWVSREAIPVLSTVKLTYLAADDVTYFHKVVIDDTGKMIGRPAIRFQEYCIIVELPRTGLLGSREMDVPVEIIVDCWPNWRAL
jgi:hypothetical protein